MGIHYSTHYHVQETREITREIIFSMCFANTSLYFIPNSPKSWCKDQPSGLTETIMRSSELSITVPGLGESTAPPGKALVKRFMEGVLSLLLLARNLSHTHIHTQMSNNCSSEKDIRDPPMIEELSKLKRERNRTGLPQ